MAYNNYGYPTEVRSGGLAEYQMAQDQLALATQLEDEANAIRDEKLPSRNSHYAAYQAHMANAAGPARQADEASNNARREVQHNNDWIRYQQRLYGKAARSGASLRAMQQELEGIGARAEAGGIGEAEAQALLARAEELGRLIQSESDRKVRIEDAMATASAKATEHAQRANHYLAQANQLNSIAQSRYDQANAAASVVNSLDSQINGAYQKANLAYEKYQQLIEQYENGSVLQWAAEEVEADGHIARFTQGNGVVTTIGYDADTRHVERVEAASDADEENVFGIDDISQLLTKVSELIQQSGAEVNALQLKRNQTQQALSTAMEQVVTTTNNIAHYQSTGEVARSISLQADLHQYEIDRETALVDVDLYAELHDVYQQTPLRPR